MYMCIHARSSAGCGFESERKLLIYTKVHFNQKKIYKIIIIILHISIIFFNIKYSQTKLIITLHTLKYNILIKMLN